MTAGAVVEVVLETGVLVVVELVVLLAVVDVVELVVAVWARTGPAQTTARRRTRITARFIVLPFSWLRSSVRRLRVVGRSISVYGMLDGTGASRGGSRR